MGFEDEKTKNLSSISEQENNQDIKVPANKTVAVREQPSLEGYTSLKENLFSNSKESVSTPSVERGFLAEQMSLERGSPTTLEPESTDIFDSQDSTLLHSQAQKEIITPEKSLATKQNFVPNEQTSSFEVETQIKDTAILSKETNKTNQNVRK